jgi:hypothetical protein
MKPLSRFHILLICAQIIEELSLKLLMTTGLSSISWFKPSNASEMSMLNINDWLVINTPERLRRNVETRLILFTGVYKYP